MRLAELCEFFHVRVGFFSMSDLETTGFTHSDFSTHHSQTFTQALTLFASPSEDVRRSAAFAVGNIVVGNPNVFLPLVLEVIKSDDKKRYLALMSVKEVGTNPLSICRAVD